MATFDRYQGDPRVVIENDGATIEITGGQPVMDQGLENVPLISLFTKKGWWGNTLFTNKDQQIGSDFEKTARQASTVSQLVKIQAAGRAALKSMVDSGLAKDTLVTARNPSGDRVNVDFVIEPPGKDILKLSATKHGANWIAQKENPAYERLA